LFSDAVGLIASFLVSISPINLLTAQRIWADQTLSLLVALTALVYYLALTKRSLGLLIVSGLVFGLSLLTKNSAVMIMIPLALCSYIYTKKITRASAYLSIFFVVALVVALPWYIAATKAFGRPLYTPYQQGISKTIDWFQFINTRPWYTFLVNIPFQVPLYILGYIALIRAALRIDRSKHYLFLSVWFVSFLVLLTYGTHRTEMLGPDNRYMLPALPALAILSARLLDSVRSFLNRRWCKPWGDIICGLSLVGCAWWSLRLAFRFIPRADVLIAPF
jgi:4-amino-4-deoxy-L-arabinose transferase-like glycosyltransferase